MYAMFDKNRNGEHNMQISSLIWPSEITKFDHIYVFYIARI